MTANLVSFMELSSPRRWLPNGLRLTPRNAKIKEKANGLDAVKHPMVAGSLPTNIKSTL